MQRNELSDAHREKAFCLDYDRVPVRGLAATQFRSGALRVVPSG
jgi:hypothetical protein